MNNEAANEYVNESEDEIEILMEVEDVEGPGSPAGRAEVMVRIPEGVAVTVDRADDGDDG